MVAESVFLPAEWLQESVDLLAEKRQIVFYGPPGTGKTFVALALCEHLTAEGGDFRLLQFHPSYSYEDFFEGYRPKPGAAGVEFVLTPGPLRQIAAAAEEDPANPYILVIDEINRGNIPKIFGELLFLLEYRERVVQPQYSPDRPFSLPTNLFLIGTMNTADRSIALVDAALRRRFFFRAFLPTEDPVGAVLTEWLRHHGLDDEPARLLAALNNDVADKEVAIGPSYFMTADGTAPNIERVWQYAILPLLEEYYFGTGRDVPKDFSITQVRKKITPNEDTFEAPAESIEGDGESASSVEAAQQ
jgi:5-methylcytosine-specific restriction protein B